MRNLTSLRVRRQTLMTIRHTQPDNGNAALRGGDKETIMRNIITPDVLKTMIPQEFEDWREAGEDLRRELTHAVMRDLTCPADWDMNGEYRSEFGGFFPVQVRFTPSHGNFHIAVCSPGDITPSWMVVFIPASGRPFSVISTLPTWSPEVISHTLSLTARLDADGYSQASIISVLAMEGAQ
ncbi:PsiB protein [Salmonella enterica subsp. arizonae]|nr:PsiB protein [Salmonella enterica subsp. arizonae]